MQKLYNVLKRYKKKLLLYQLHHQECNTYTQNNFAFFGMRCKVIACRAILLAVAIVRTSYVILWSSLLQSWKFNFIVQSYVFLYVDCHGCMIFLKHVYKILTLFKTVVAFTLWGSNNFFMSDAGCLEKSLLLISGLVLGIIITGEIFWYFKKEGFWEG